jgi:hypothetical protein
MVCVTLLAGGVVVVEPDEGAVVVEEVGEMDAPGEVEVKEEAAVSAPPEPPPQADSSSPTPTNNAAPLNFFNIDLVKSSSVNTINV